MLCDAQNASSRLKAWCKSAHEHAKGTEHHLVQAAQQFAVALAKLAHEKSCSRAFEAVLLNVRDSVADQRSLVANTRQFLD